MPPSFVQILDADRQKINQTATDLMAGFGASFSVARPFNYAGFIGGSVKAYQIVSAYLFYPLTPSEEASIDRLLADPEAFSKLSGAGVEAGALARGQTATVTVLPGMNKFADKSVGVTTLQTSSCGEKARTDTVFVRRGAVYEVFNSVYPDQSQPPLAIADMVKILDARVAATAAAATPTADPTAATVVALAAATAAATRAQSPQTRAGRLLYLVADPTSGRNALVTGGADGSHPDIHHAPGWTLPAAGGCGCGCHVIGLTFCRRVRGRPGANRRAPHYAFGDNPPRPPTASPSCFRPAREF